MSRARTRHPARRERPTLLTHIVALGRPWRTQLVVVGACVLGAAVLELIPPLVIRHAIDHNITRNHAAGLGAAAVLYLGAATAVAALTAYYGYLAASVAQRALAALRTRLFAHLLALPTEYHDQTPIGDSISRATADVEAIDDLFSSSAATLLGETVRVLTVSIAMVALSPILAAATVLVVPPLMLITHLLRRRIRDAERDTRIAVGALNTHLAEDLAGVEVIQAFGRQATFAERFRRAMGPWLNATNRSVIYNAYYAPALGVLAASATALLLWLGARDSFGPNLTSVGTLTAFLLLFARFFTPLVNLGDEWNAVQAALAGAERVFTVLNHPTAQSTGQVPARGHSPYRTQPLAVAHHPNPTDNGARIPLVQMRDVTFGYGANGDAVLRGVTLEVRPGEHVAIVGRTGAGKSSVLSLLGGLYQPWRGSIHLAGRDPYYLDDPERRALIGVVPQAVTLFSGTVTDNITLADPAVTPAQVIQAAQLAGVDTFVNSLPEGYHTTLSDAGRGAGVQLSAGQRQLLALARALVNSPPIVLLDEATAVIDGTSDNAFRVALKERVQATDAAVLTVAHRLATAREADRVVVLSRGQIIEQGTPTALLAAGGHFADLVALEDAGWDWQREIDQP